MIFLCFIFKNTTAMNDLPTTHSIPEFGPNKVRLELRNARIPIGKFKNLVMEIEDAARALTPDVLPPL
jgi:hypothetical protein